VTDLLQAEALENQKVALVSKLYQDGELDIIYKGTIASRRLIAVRYVLYHSLHKH
jgi:hypothetical protein